MNRQLQTLGKRAFYFARRSAVLRRAVAMPGIAAVVNRICGRILQPAPEYPKWIERRLIQRRELYACAGERGLLSFLTTVWNTPLDLLKPALDSLLLHQTVREFQWVVLDNGSAEPEVVSYLKQTAAADPRVVFLRVEENLGIIGGMHLALMHATGQYVLPFDSDDLLYPDAVAILTHQLRAHHYPAAMFSDEDKLQEAARCWPSFKPDWDPVLFLNSCYVAHLGCIKRSLAVELGMYTDRNFDGCHDWDAFTRLMLAGHVPVHIPEMLYTWRMHGNSTAGNIGSKNYIYQSQKKLLERYLDQTGPQGKFEIRLSPLFQGTPDWWLQRKPVDAMAVLRVVIHNEQRGVDQLFGDRPAGRGFGRQSQKHTALRAVDKQVIEPPEFALGSTAARVNADDDPQLILPRLENVRGLILVTHDTLKLENDDWRFEVTGLFERHPDAVMIGGRVLNARGKVVDAGRVPGFAGIFGCPDKGRDRADPGNLAELWKQRSVSGVSTGLCVIQAEFLRDVLDAFPKQSISWRFLGAWAALLAWRTHRRIIYTPFLSGVCDADFDSQISPEETAAFTTEAGGFLHDRRYYNRHFGVEPSQAYQPIG